jgi:O-acetyl-ADP-ribose deacetylase (regulator of RNase III)
MIQFTNGNLLDAPVEALVNTVNTEGVMGKGIALQFKQAFPEMYRAYEAACAAGEVKLGRMHVFDLGGLVGGPRWIINFPTKGHWRSRSRLSDIKSGLSSLAETIRKLEIKSIAIPPLGCGNGGLNWAEVQPLIVGALGQLEGVDLRVYPPAGVPQAEAMPNRTARPHMTIGQAALIALMDRYLKGLLDPFVSLLELHKLMYFMQEAGQRLRLKYQADLYGPYAVNLRQVLIRMESHFISGYGDGRDNPDKVLHLMPGAVEEATAFLEQDSQTKNRMDQVGALMEGYEDPFGLELLSSVHWIMRSNSDAASDPSAAYALLHAWNDRKQKLFKPEHVKKAWLRLMNQGWVPSTDGRSLFDQTSH